MTLLLNNAFDDNTLSVASRSQIAANLKKKMDRPKIAPKPNSEKSKSRQIVRRNTFTNIRVTEGINVSVTRTLKIIFKKENKCERDDFRRSCC